MTEVVDARIVRAEEQIHVLMDHFEAGDQARLSAFREELVGDEGWFIVLGLAFLLQEQERSNGALRKLAAQDARAWNAQKFRAEKAERQVQDLRGTNADQANMIANLRKKVAA